MLACSLKALSISGPFIWNTSVKQYILFAVDLILYLSECKDYTEAAQSKASSSLIDSTSHKYHFLRKKSVIQRSIDKTDGW